jgi:uncharacterized repeat protein (TIGR03803 family)
MYKVNWGKIACGVFLLCATAVAASLAQDVVTFTTLAWFYPGTNGLNPKGALVQATNGNFYGTTYDGGTGGGSGGTVFTVTPTGMLASIVSFTDTAGEGVNPDAGLVQGTDGSLYGTTYSGGTSGGGTVFKVTPTGSLTTLYVFCLQFDCPDGEWPEAPLIQATDGNFYGTTYIGGANRLGTVFKITPSGELTTLHSFCSQGDCRDGSHPQAGLIQGADGNFYGTTSLGGFGGAPCGSGPNEGCGVIFRMTPEGVVTTLHAFCSGSVRGNCTDGSFPEAGLSRPAMVTSTGRQFLAGHMTRAQSLNLPLVAC